MPSHIACDADNFARGIAELLGDIPAASSEGCQKAVSQTIRKTASGLRSGNYGSSGRHKWSPEYMSGFSSAVVKGGATPAGEVGNKNKPGLVHLLEKGHATLNGRRTASFPHMAPAFDDMEKDFVDRVSRYIVEAIS